MAKKVQAKAQKTQKARATTSTAAPQIKHMSVGSSWNKVAGSAPWVGGQASTLAPGSPAAVSRRKYRQTKFKSRTRKVIRPRIAKQRRRPDK